ncbi:MAG TPA: FAD-dependent oxidoreductase [Pyrinomonadaceae bacterium]
MSYDVAVVGAGIVGAACAYYLSSEGLSVAIIDAKGIASGTTAAGMGHIVVMDDSQAQLALTRYSQELWSHLAPELPKQCEFENCGTIWVAADENEMKEVHRKRSLYAEYGLQTEILDTAELSDAEPNLRPGLAGGLLVPGDKVVYQMSATAFLIQRAVEHGAALHCGKRAVAIFAGGVRLENGDAINARFVVNAAGINAPALSPRLTIAPRKGHLVVTDRYPNFARHQIVELGYLRSAHGNASSSVAFNVQPRATGQVIIGSSRQFGINDNGIDIDIVRRMTTRAFEYMPRLKTLSAIRVWTGSRPATPDNLPYIGRSPNSQDVFIAAGHEGLGITTSLGTGQIIADLITGREPAIPVEPYSPARIDAPAY